MTPSELKTFFTLPYERSAWLQTLRAIFPNTDIFAQPQGFDIGDSRAESIAQLGNARLAGDRNLAILEVMVGDTTDLAKNRVGLRNLVSRFIDQAAHHGVLAVFRSPDPNYRFTFAARESAFDETGAIVRKETAPRRYTYLLGPGESCRTAAERFGELAQMGTAAELKHVIEAFNVEKLNKAFFTDFCGVFQKVREDIAERHTKWPKELVEQQTQTLLNRLLFLYFLQRKGWLNRQHNFLVRNFRDHYANKPAGHSYFDEFLNPLFMKLSTEGSRADFADYDLPFLNGGLFADEHGGEQWDETIRRHGELRVGNATFKHVFDGLLENYNFTIREDSPRDQEVAIDPEMLGKIFESLVLQIETSVGGTASLRHDTGSHYTPRPIVHYLCIAGLRAWLEQFPPDAARAKDWPERIEKILALDASDGIDEHEKAVLSECLTTEEAQALIDRMENLRACDLAVGSGAFPVGLLHVLVNITRLCTTRARGGKDPVERDGNWLYDTKSNIIRRVIYGVDIQERAVEICKLRLWLSLMVDFELEADADNCSRAAFRSALKKITPLPNLDYKIRRADSLIDKVRGHPVNFAKATTQNTWLPPILNKLTSAKRAFYDASALPDKRRLRFEILDALAELAEEEFKFSKMNLQVLIAAAPDDAELARHQELQEAIGEVHSFRLRLQAAKKLKTAAAKDEELDELAGYFDDKDKPTFVWEFDFAEVFHREGARGFDFVVGNPPYVRTQSLPADVTANLKQRYVSARKGNYDLYVPFVEQGLQLLQPNGHLAYILPHKFFNAQYGEPLRALVAKGRHLRHVVHFGDQQIFPGATNYVCLLFLSKPGSEQCRFARADNLTAWLASGTAVEAMFQSNRVTSSAWNFVVGNGAKLFDKLQKMPVKIGDAADIFVGLQTSADDVFIMNFISETARTITLESKVLEQPWTFEKDLMHSIVSGTDVSPFLPLPNRQFVLFPYRIVDDSAELLPMKDLSNSWPRTAEYLKQNKRRLEERESGKLRGTVKWHGYIYLKNMTRQNDNKLCVPRMVEYLHAAFDFDGSHFLDNVDVGGVTFRASHKNHGLAYLLALLNSRLLRWFFPQISAPFRGGFRSANKQFLSVIPFRPINFEDGAERAEHDALVTLAEKILAAKRVDAGADVSGWEREIDERVYRLYALTPDEIKIVEDSSKR